jgi:NADH-quinone oxidoreductase subunit G
MCLVEVEKFNKPLPACATQVSEGMKVSTKSKIAVEAQESVSFKILLLHLAVVKHVIRKKNVWYLIKI